MWTRHLFRIKEVVISISRDAAARATRKALSMNTAREVEQFVIGLFALSRETASSV